MDAGLSTIEAGVNRVTALDTFLQSLEETRIASAAEQGPSSLANAASPDLEAAGPADGGDLRALTSGAFSTSISPSTAPGGRMGMASPGDNGGRDVVPGVLLLDPHHEKRGPRTRAERVARPQELYYHVQREILRVLDWTFSGDRTLVDSCIQILDKSRLVKVRARTSGRTVWLVQGSRGSPYLCLRNYCSCRSFLELIRRGCPQPVLCKHLLAVRLAPALGVSCLEEVDDQRLADRIGDCAYG